MNKVIQLKHPTGKKAIAMDGYKYETMKEAMLNCFRERGALTHTEMLKAVKSYFQKSQIKFKGSVEWHMEWVKLDMEANTIISRVIDDSKIKYKLELN